ncbi:MAG: MFS transporter, partial [Elusimicrobiota bacterium]|nr:MFS transporter [Elusimicrobiota bacterium]
MKKLLNVFKRDFTSVFIAQLTGAFNDNLFRTAFATFIIYKAAAITPSGRNFFTLAALAAYMAPFFIFSIPSGELADKYDKAKVIRWIKFSEIFTALLILLG